MYALCADAWFHAAKRKASLVEHYLQIYYIGHESVLYNQILILSYYVLLK